MKQSIKTKVMAILLALTLCLGSLAAAPCSAQAAESDYVTLLSKSGLASPWKSITYSFNVTSSGYTAVDILLEEPLNFVCSIKSASETLYEKEIPANDPNWVYVDSLKAYDFPLDWSSQPGDYSITMTFKSEVNYVLSVMQKKADFSLSDTNLILTKGFSQKLSAVNGSGEITWSSSNTKVASVDKNGKVTGKKAGSATITATLTDGSKATCKVSVKNNTYKNSKLTIGQAKYGNAYISIYKASYTKKGDLAISAAFLNNRGYRMTSIRNLKIVVKNKSGKTIGTYKLNKKNVSILHGGQKSFTFTLKKSQMKLKTTQDLRNATFKPTWKYTYSFYK